MASRPPIPADVERSILIEAGHRCAVCGVPCPLERAHIIPWHQRQSHQAEDLICLCANCHERADSEKWGEKALREYKLHPWVLRQSNHGSYNPEALVVAYPARVEIVIDMEIKDFDDHEEDMLRHALAGLLRISPQKVRILSKREGSVRVLLELPKENAGQLIHLHQQDARELQRHLASFKIETIRRVASRPNTAYPSSANVYVYTLGPDRHGSINREPVTPKLWRLWPDSLSVLRILLVAASPWDLAELDLEDERHKLVSAIEGGPFNLEFLDRATKENLRHTLQRSKYDGREFHILHFMGHSRWDKNTGEGKIVLERDDGSSDPVGGMELATLLRDFKNLRLVALDICKPIRGNPTPFSSVASSLLLHGLPAVAARLPGKATMAFSDSLYEGLLIDVPEVSIVKEKNISARSTAPTLFFPISKRISLRSRLLAVGAAILFCSATVKIILDSRQEITTPQSPIVYFYLADRATVPSELLVRGKAGDPRRYYYLFVRDLTTGSCYIQDREPLTLDKNGEWHAMVRFFGKTGQSFQLIAVAAQRLLKTEELMNCGENVRDIQSAGRSVRLAIE